jgi:hypothetical protein
MKTANLTLAFLVELAMLVAFGVWGAAVATSTVGRVALALGAPLAAAAIWFVWLAPRAPRRLLEPELTAMKLAMFGAATVALIVAGHVVLAIVFAVVAVVNTLLLRVLEDRSSPLDPTT